MEIRKADGIASCNCCNAVNFDSRLPYPVGKRVEALYEIRLGNMMVTLCEDCMKALREQMGVALEEVKA